MIRHTLRESIQWMKSVARVRRRHDPLVMRFVQRLVYQRMVQSAVDPVDEEIGEANEERELEDVVEREGRIRGAIVEFGKSAHFTEKQGRGEDGHYGEGDEGLFDLEPDLVAQVFGVCEGCVVEDEDVGKGRAEEVDDGAEKPVSPFSKRDGVIENWKSYHVMRYRLKPCR